MKPTALALLIAVLSAPTFAAPQAFVIDNNHSFPRFSYSHLGYTTQTSRFNRTTGKVTLDTDARTVAVDVVIDMQSVDTGSPLFNEHIQKDDLLDTMAYPTATFKSTRVRFDGERPAEIDGDLTIKNVTRPVTLRITSFQHKPHPMLKKDAIGASATTTISRTAFGAPKFTPFVGDEVTIDIVIEAIAEE